MFGKSLFINRKPQSAIIIYIFKNIPSHTISYINPILRGGGGGCYYFLRFDRKHFRVTFDFLADTHHLPVHVLAEKKSLGNTNALL
jgi:hypothetical protein